MQTLTVFILLSAGVDYNKQGSPIDIYTHIENLHSFKASNFEVNESETNPKAGFTIMLEKKKKLRKKENVVHSCSLNSFNVLIKIKC